MIMIKKIVRIMGIIDAVAIIIFGLIDKGSHLGIMMFLLAILAFSACVQKIQLK